MVEATRHFGTRLLGGLGSPSYLPCFCLPICTAMTICERQETQSDSQSEDQSTPRMYGYGIMVASRVKEVPRVSAVGPSK
jgi:hypothetical protein